MKRKTTFLMKALTLLFVMLFTLTGARAQSAMPTNLTVTNVGPNTATVSWDGVEGATGYELQYGVGDYTNKTTLSYDNGTRAGAIGSEGDQTWTWGVMYPANQVTGSMLTTVSIYETAYNDGDITINVYSGGTNAPGTLLYTETVATEAADAFHEVKLATPVLITSGQNLWITLTETGTFVMSYCTLSQYNSNAQMVDNNGNWTSLYSATSNYNFIRSGWMIRAEITDGIDPSTITWNTKNPATSPCLIEGLTQETHYIVRVRALYNSNESQWTINDFTTTISNPVPTSVVADPSYTTADISWTGFSTSYEVQYRKAGFFDDFQNGLGQWTIYTKGGHRTDYEGWIWVGHEMASAYSWYPSSSGYGTGTIYNADNWLITPAVELGGTLTFDVDIDASYPDKYEVLLSTTGNATDDFNVTLKNMAQGADGTVTIDLSAYAGQTGYIAIHHADRNQFFLNIDNFEIDLGNEWITVTTNDPSVVLTGLDPDTEYEYKITGKKNGNPDVSTARARFTTKPAYILANAEDNTQLISDHDGETCNIILDSRTFSTGKWYTLCLPFNVTIANSPLAGADARKLDTDNTRIEGKTLKLEFSRVTELKAGTPYIIRWESGSTITNPVFENVTISKAKPDVSCDLKNNRGVQFVGIYDPKTYTEVDQSKLFINNNTFYYVGKNTTMNAQRAYFQLIGFIYDTGATSVGGVKEFGITFLEEDPTGIEDVNVNLNLNDEPIYNIAGQRIQKMQKGINIVNGKKIFVK